MSEKKIKELPFNHRINSYNNILRCMIEEAYSAGPLDAGEYPSSRKSRLYARKIMEGR